MPGLMMKEKRTESLPELSKVLGDTQLALLNDYKKGIVSIKNLEPPFPQLFADGNIRGAEIDLMIGKHLYNEKLGTGAVAINLKDVKGKPLAYSIPEGATVEEFTLVVRGEPHISFKQAERIAEELKKYVGGTFYGVTETTLGEDRGPTGEVAQIAVIKVSRPMI